MAERTPCGGSRARCWMDQPLGLDLVWTWTERRWTHSTCRTSWPLIYATTQDRIWSCHHQLSHQKTSVPVPTIYHYNSNPFNRLGGEWILMSKVCFNLLITKHSSDCHIFPGATLSQAYHGLAYNSLVKLLKNLAAIIITIVSHRFSEIGSLYFGPNPQSSGFSTPKALPDLYSAFPFSPTLAMSTISYVPYLETKVWTTG